MKAESSRNKKRMQDGEAISYIMSSVIWVSIIFVNYFSCVYCVVKLNTISMTFFFFSPLQYWIHFPVLNTSLMPLIWLSLWQPKDNWDFLALLGAFKETLHHQTVKSIMLLSQSWWKSYSKITFLLAVYVKALANQVFDSFFITFIKFVDKTWKTYFTHSLWLHIFLKKSWFVAKLLYLCTILY